MCFWNQTYISTLYITQVDTHTPACDFPWGWRWPFPGLHWGPCTEWPVSRCPSLAWTNHCPCPQEMGEQSGPLILNPHQAHCNTHTHTHKVTWEAHKTRHEVNRLFTAVCSLIYLQIQASPGYSVCKGKCRSSMSQRCVTCMHVCTLVLDWCVQSHQLKLVKLSGLVKLVL